MISHHIAVSNEKKLIGKMQIMTFADNTTAALWRSFMPEKKKILHTAGTDLISLQIYPSGFSSCFKPTTPFQKWAAVEVTDFDTIPNDLETFVLPSGLYAVFHYKGAAEAAGPTYQYIHGTWLPNSDYVLDDRPHFEVLGDKYKNGSCDSEEELWIPIRLKNTQ